LLLWNYAVFVNVIVVIPVPIRPVTVSVIVQVIVIVSTPPADAGTIKVPVAPGKIAVPPELVVVADGGVNVSDVLVETKEVEITIVWPAKSLEKGSVIATKPAAGDIVNGKAVPPACAVVNVSEIGGMTVSNRPVMVKEAKLERLPVLAITVIVCVPLIAREGNETPTDPELFVLKVPREMFWLPIWALNVIGTPIKLLVWGLVYVAVALTTDPVAEAVTVMPPFSPAPPLPQPDTNNESRAIASSFKYIIPPKIISRFNL
jgi:hypothetical protein